MILNERFDMYGTLTYRGIWSWRTAADGNAIDPVEKIIEDWVGFVTAGDEVASGFFSKVIHTLWLLTMYINCS